MITLSLVFRVSCSLSCLHATRVRFGDASVVAAGVASKAKFPLRGGNVAVQFQTLWFETLTAVCFGDIPPDQSLKMIGLVLASYRTDSIPCSLNTCAFTAAHACTSPQPTVSLAHGCWNLQGIAQGRAHVSTPPGGKMVRQNLPSAQCGDGRAVPGNPS